jgi:hypothetical protein
MTRGKIGDAYARRREGKACGKLSGEKAGRAL